MNSVDSSNGELQNTFVSLSGHMVSSFTEGEVKEKEAVVFRSYLKNSQNISRNVWTKVNLDTLYTDVDDNKIGNDSDFVDGGFKHSVAGWYQVGGSLNSSSSPRAISMMAGLYRNGTRVSESGMVDDTQVSQVNFTDIVYLNGTTDFIELWGYINSTVTNTVLGRNDLTYLTAHLITGQSSGGGTTDIFPTIIAGTINGDGTTVSGAWGTGGYTCSLEETGKYIITFDTPRDSVDYVVNTTSYTGSARCATANNYTKDGFIVWVNEVINDTATTFNQSFSFTVTGVDPVAVGTGGDSVWTEVGDEAVYDLSLIHI